MRFAKCPAILEGYYPRTGNLSPRSGQWRTSVLLLRAMRTPRKSKKNLLQGSNFMNERIAWSAALVAIFGFLATTSATAGQYSISPTTDDHARWDVGQPIRGNSQLPISRATAASIFATVFDCEGSFLHQSVDGKIASSVSFWFGVHENYEVAGMITKTGSPLELPARSITGDLTANHDFRNEFIGGKLKLNWPYSQNEEQVELALMRETFIRVGPRVNGVSKIKRRTSNHTYVAGRMWFDPKSHPALASLRRVSFITATCVPNPDLPAAGGRQM